MFAMIVMRLPTLFCCLHFQGWGKNEMYPCIDQNVTYGLAVTGLAVAGTSVSALFQGPEEARAEWSTRQHGSRSVVSWTAAVKGTERRTAFGYSGSGSDSLAQQ